MMTSFSKKWKKESVSTELWFHRNFSTLPVFKLQPLDTNVFASYSGPDCGLAFLHNLENPKDEKANTKRKAGMSEDGKPIAGCLKWNLKNRKAYGISMSLYDQHPINGKITGDPIADCFGMCARGNSSLMVVADGVNWGEKSRLAARCAVYGVMKYIDERLFPDGSKHSEEDEVIGSNEGRCDLTEGEDESGKNGEVMTSSLAEELGINDDVRKDSKIITTKDVFRLILTSLESAHKTILKHDGGLTTLCICLVCPIASSPINPSVPSVEEDCPLPTKYAACVVNVGDSLAFVFSRRHGVREITCGSHDVTLERNIRDAGGALGPVSETGEPELNNLTCSITCVEAGDVVFLATDGITDNFDPVVTKVAVSKKVDVSPSISKTSLKNKGTIEFTLKSPVENSSTSEQNVEEADSEIPLKQMDFESMNEDIIKDHEPKELPLNLDVENVTIESHDPLERPITDVTEVNESNVSPRSDDHLSGFSSNQIDEDVDNLKIGQKSLELQSIEESSTNDLKKILSDGEYLKERPETESDEVKVIECLGLENGKPVMLPFERHRYAIKEMERVIHEFELFTECPCSAQELCGALLQHVLKLTDPKRKVLENPELYGKKKRLKAEERQNRDSEIVLKLAQSPGKLDHATVLGYEVGRYLGNEDEDYYTD